MLSWISILCLLKQENTEKNTIQHDMIFRMNDGLAVIFSDAAFRKIDGKAGFGFAIWFNGSFVVAGSLDRLKVSSSKEAEERPF